MRTRWLRWTAMCSVAALAATGLLQELARSGRIPASDVATGPTVIIAFFALSAWLADGANRDEQGHTVTGPPTRTFWAIFIPSCFAVPTMVLIGLATGFFPAWTIPLVALMVGLGLSRYQARTKSPQRAVLPQGER